MISDLRSNMDMILVVVAALAIYHFFLKAKGSQKGIAK